MTPWELATVGVDAPLRAAFYEFVLTQADPSALDDVDRLGALRVTFALHKRPEAWPCTEPRKRS